VPCGLVQQQGDGGELHQAGIRIQVNGLLIHPVLWFLEVRSLPVLRYEVAGPRVLVTITTGYDQTNGGVPPEITQALLLLVTDMFVNRVPSAQADRTTAAVRSLLDPYRLRNNL
jgi:hypothetical protein